MCGKEKPALTLKMTHDLNPCDDVPKDLMLLIQGICCLSLTEDNEVDPLRQFASLQVVDQSEQGLPSGLPGISLLHTYTQWIPA